MGGWVLIGDSSYVSDIVSELVVGLGGTGAFRIWRRPRLVFPISPSAMFGVGAGLNAPVLHAVDDDFPDELIDTVIGIFDRIIERRREGI